MGFYHSKSKLPLRGRKKLPLRGRRARRLKLLRQFEIGRVYTFSEFWRLDLPDDCWLEEKNYDDYQNC